MESLFSAALGISTPWFVKSITFDPKLKRRIKIYGQRRWQCKAASCLWYAGKRMAASEFLWTRVLSTSQGSSRETTRWGSVRLIQAPWSGLQNGFTLLFEALVLQLSKHMPIHQVAKLIHSSDHKVWSILDKYVEGARASSDYSEVAQLGIDETSIAKGHDYVSLFVDLKRKKTIFVTEGKGSATVSAFKNGCQLWHVACLY